jgi:ligand-binding SRPBCC domain-containing protein
MDGTYKPDTARDEHVEDMPVEGSGHPHRHCFVDSMGQLMAGDRVHYPCASSAIGVYKIRRITRQDEHAR